jgi:predicted nucleic-acid-binding protein
MKPERVFADTNLFLRYLTNDVPEQADAVERLLRRAAAGEIALATNSLVLAEIVWTLESFYRLGRDDIRARILAILNTPGLEVTNGDLVLQALAWYVDRNVDFIDGYNAAWLLDEELKTVYTFDRRHWSRIEGLVVLTPGEEAPPPRT